MIGAVAVVVLAIVAIIAVTAAPPSQGPTYTVKAGDWIKYQLSANTTTAKANYTYQVISVNASTVFFVMMTDQNGINTILGYGNKTWNESVFSTDPSHLPLGEVATYIGTASLTTKWGVLETQHYNLTTAETSGELFLIHRAMVKETVRSPMQTLTFMVIDSNMAQFTEA